MSYRLRKIVFKGRTVPILMQNENGPCPLLAICNILLLQGQLHIHTDYSEVPSEKLLQDVANRVLESNPPVRIVQLREGAEDEGLKVHACLSSCRQQTSSSVPIRPSRSRT